MSGERVGIRSHRDLLVWQRGMELAALVYGLARELPAEEKFGLVSQMCRAAVSVPANIAEGHGRAAPREFAHFLSIAKGSVMEVETLIMLTSRLGYVAESRISALLARTDEIGRMLTTLRERVNDRARTQHSPPTSH